MKRGKICFITLAAVYPEVLIVMTDGNAVKGYTAMHLKYAV